MEKATATAGSFRRRYGTPVNCDHFRDKVVIPALRAVGLPVTIRTYDLRHSHASLFRPRGQPVGRRERMGHSDPSVTLSVYGHLFEGTQARLSEQLDALREATVNAPKTGQVVGIDSWRDRTQAGHA